MPPVRRLGTADTGSAALHTTHHGTARRGNPAPGPLVPAPGFSLLRRHAAARALSAYVLAEVESGRPIADVLLDGWVFERTLGAPWLLDDLAEDQLILEALRADADAATADAVLPNAVV